MVYGNFKDLPRGTAAEKLCENAFNIAKNLKYVGYQHQLASLVYKFFDKKSSGCDVKSEIIPNKNLLKKIWKKKDILILLKTICEVLILRIYNG